MFKIVMVFLIVFIGFLLLGLILYRKTHHRERPVTYICNTCGEKDCLCHREE
jgi:hypothetical protein